MAHSTEFDIEHVLSELRVTEHEDPQAYNAFMDKRTEVIEHIFQAYRGVWTTLKPTAAHIHVNKDWDVDYSLEDIKGVYRSLEDIGAISEYSNRINPQYEIGRFTYEDYSVIEKSVSIIEAEDEAMREFVDLEGPEEHGMQRPFTEQKLTNFM